MLFALRVTITGIPPDEKNELLKYIKSKCTDYFIVLEHEDTNEHYQGLLDVITSSVCVRMVRENFLKGMRRSIESELKGNKSYSMKECKDKPKYLRYLCKGDTRTSPPTVVAQNIPVNACKLQENYWEENDDNKKKSCRYYQMWTHPVPPKYEDTLLNKIMFYHLDNNKLLPTPGIVSRYMDTCLFKYGDDNSIKYLLSKYKKLVSYY